MLTKNANKLLRKVSRGYWGTNLLDNTKDYLKDFGVFGSVYRAGKGFVQGIANRYNKEKYAEDRKKWFKEYPKRLTGPFDDCGVYSKDSHGNLKLLSYPSSLIGEEIRTWDNLRADKDIRKQRMSEAGDIMKENLPEFFN